MDFAHANANVTENTTQAVTNGWAPRLRKAYGTMGGFLVGQETGFSTTPMPTPSSRFWRRSFERRAGARAAGQIHLSGSLRHGVYRRFENPVPRMTGPFGPVDIDALGCRPSRPCSVTGNTVANLPATTACIRAARFLTR